MRFFLVDDDATVRTMISDIIEEEGLGTIVGEAKDGSEVTNEILSEKNVDILLIDLLMPKRDGIETIIELNSSYQGKIVMISQVEIKELIGEAYSLGIEYYITKPINRLEVVNVLKKVTERILLENSIQHIQHTLSNLTNTTHSLTNQNSANHQNSKWEEIAKQKLLDLGILFEGGHKDLLDLLEVIKQKEVEKQEEFTSLKELFEEMAFKKVGTYDPKEVKAAEQRVRRSIHQSLDHIAALGITDFSNPIFEHYASTYFDFPQVRMKMLELQGKKPMNHTHARINIKKFIQVLYMEVKQEAAL